QALAPTEGGRRSGKGRRCVAAGAFRREDGEVAGWAWLRLRRPPPHRRPAAWSARNVRRTRPRGRGRAPSGRARQEARWSYGITYSAVSTRTQLWLLPRAPTARSSSPRTCG